ncbi:MAG: glutathione S-transferase family protein [Aphanocapsa sp. GSE-SYN-MK-11-07L]|jgi:glutathione S-transferase|nr:glutathione S-transferase family protein [Aphanocapsa sp. GSE-SYN-MK-11-07L]
MAEIEIYSAVLCPFAHRSRLTLLEKQVPFKLIEIDLQNKPANFQEISPYGKVPVLKHGEHRVWESAIVNEYLEETFPEPPLLPKNPIQRAQARIWINFADTRLFAAIGRLLYSQDSQPQTAILKELTEHLQFIEQEGLRKISDADPYWLGADISLVDLTYYPWFEQIGVLEHFRGFQLPAGLDRLQEWWQTMANRESVRAIAKPQEFYIEHYAQYALRNQDRIAV